MCTWVRGFLMPKHLRQSTFLGLHLKWGLLSPYINCLAACSAAASNRIPDRVFFYKSNFDKWMLPESKRRKVLTPAHLNVRLPPAPVSLLSIAYARYCLCLCFFPALPLQRQLHSRFMNVSDFQPKLHHHSLPRCQICATILSPPMSDRL